MGIKLFIASNKDIYLYLFIFDFDYLLLLIILILHASFYALNPLEEMVYPYPHSL